MQDDTMDKSVIGNSILEMVGYLAFLAGGILLGFGIASGMDKSNYLDLSITRNMQDDQVYNCTQEGRIETCRVETVFKNDGEGRDIVCN